MNLKYVLAVCFILQCICTLKLQMEAKDLDKRIKTLETMVLNNAEIKTN